MELFKTITLGALLLTLFLADCAQPTPENPFNLGGTRWRLSSLDSGGRTLTPVAGTEITLEFGRDGKLTGNAGCNHYGGTYQAMGEILSVPAMQVTEMACTDADIMELETTYLSALQASRIFEKRGNALNIIFGEGGGTLRFVSF